MATMEELAQRVRSVIYNNRYLTMATSNGDEVWIAPLAYYVEPNYTFVYYSSREAKHSKHIEENPIVACAIYNSCLPSDEVDGIQFLGKVSLIPSRELLKIVPAYFKQSFPDHNVRMRWQQPVSEFRGLAVKRFYRIEPLNMFTIDLESIKVDRRVEVDLTVLRRIPIQK